MKFLLIKEYSQGTRTRELFQADSDSVRLLLDNVDTAHSRVVVLADDVWIHPVDANGSIEYTDELSECGSRYWH